MNGFINDYECRTVREGVVKYNIPDDWCGEFDIYEGDYPIFCIPVDQIRHNPKMMDLKLRVVENQEEEYAGCVVIPEKKTISFKIDRVRDLIEADKKPECD